MTLFKFKNKGFTMEGYLHKNNLDDETIVVDEAGAVSVLGTILNMNKTLDFSVDELDTSTALEGVANGTYTDSTGNIILVIDGKYTKLHSDTGWKTPTLLNGFVNYNNSYQQARYKVINNVLHVQGLIKEGANGKTIFKLPLEISSRISSRHIMIVDISGAANGRVDVIPDGDILVVNFSTSWTSINFTLALD